MLGYGDSICDQAVVLIGIFFHCVNHDATDSTSCCTDSCTQEYRSSKDGSAHGPGSCPDEERSGLRSDALPTPDN